MEKCINKSRKIKFRFPIFDQYQINTREIDLFFYGKKSFNLLFFICHVACVLFIELRNFDFIFILKMKRKIDHDKKGEPDLKKQKIDSDEEESEEESIEFYEIPELGLPMIISPTQTANQIFQGIIRSQDDFKDRPENVECRGCTGRMTYPEKWKSVKKWKPELLQFAKCIHCDFMLKLHERCKVLEKEYFKDKINLF